MSDNGTEELLLKVYEDTDMLTVLVALFHWNPRTIEEITEDVESTIDIITKKVNSLVGMGFIETKDNKYRISCFGKLYIESLGITKDELNEQMGQVA